MEFSYKSLKKCLLVLVAASAFLTSEAQESGTGNNQDQPQTNRGVSVVTGTITDASTRKPLSGVRLTYQDFSAAITDSGGGFSLRVPNYNVTIVVQGEGYQTKEIALRGQSTVKAAVFEEGFSSIYETATLPFGAVPKSKIPFAISSIETHDNWGRPSEAPDAYLQGKVAGLNAIRRSGTPTVGANLFLRGISSLNTTNQPLIVVDGVIFDIASSGGSLFSNNFTNPLSWIDIKDIDEVTVIKDGSSTYGTRGGNGVIMITTSRAKELATRIDFSAYGGINFSPKTLPVLDASQYRLYLSDVLQSSGLTAAQVAALPYMSDDPNNPNYYRYHYQTNWQNEVLDNSSFQNYYLKVTGGDNIAKYALSLGHMTNGGVLRETSFKRSNVRFNADLNLSRRLTATANLSFTLGEQDLKDQGLAYKTNPLYVALVKSPFVSVHDVSSKGVESPTLTDSDTFNVSNPVALINNMRARNRNYRFFGNVGFNYTLSQSVTLSTVVGITVDKIRENMFIPRRGVVDDTLDNGIIADSRLGSLTKRVIGVFNDTRLSYNRRFSRIHELAVNVGVRFQSSKSEDDSTFSANSATDELTSVTFGTSTTRQISGFIYEWRRFNNYFNAKYSLSDKYFFSFNMAIDGSSRFGRDIPSALKIGNYSYAVLPSVAGAWLISSENFMANSRLIDMLKLRASYGLSGNDDIGNYTYRGYYTSQNLLGIQGLVRGNIGNNGLQWESMKKLNVGADIALFNERLNLTVDAYQNKTDKMLVYETLPTVSGLGFAAANSGAMKTTGVDASVTGRVLNKSKLKFDLGVTIGRYNSSVTKLPQDIYTDYAGGTILSRVGNDPNVFYGYKSNGVFSSDAEADSDRKVILSKNGTALPFRGGDVRFVDFDNNDTIDTRDMQVIGNPNPDFFGSVSARFEYKRFALEGLFTFMQGNDIYNYTRRQLESVSSFNNQTEAVINRWRAAGQITDIPRATYGDPLGNSRFSDRWIEDGSYFRLRTATLTYNVPIRPSGFLRYSIVYLTANNLFTLTKYKGFDPEMSATSSALGQGVDVTLEPQHRSVILGVRFGL